MSETTWFQQLARQLGWNFVDAALACVGPVFAGLLLIAGAFLMTRPEGYESADRADQVRRRWIRIVSLVPLLALGMILTEEAWLTNTRGARQLDLVFVATVGLLTVGVTPLPLLGFIQLRSLANRAGSRHLAEHCWIVGIGASATLLVVFWVVMLGTYAERLGLDPNWTGRSSAWMATMLLTVTAGFLFWLWTIYLMARFAWSFGRAYRDLKRSWREADRAIA